MRILTFVAALLCAIAKLDAAESPALYREDFSMTATGSLPTGLLVLDGGFAVQQQGDCKFLELPGAPLETYGVLFGPPDKTAAARAASTQKPVTPTNVLVQARIFGTAKGRRFPTFAVATGGVGGYRLQVSPGKQELELFRGDTDQASVPFTWTPGAWLWLRLEVRQIEPGAWRIEGRTWKDGAAPPADPTVVWIDKQAPKPGRASVWGSPFSGTPIRFDDLSVSQAQ